MEGEVLQFLENNCQGFNQAIRRQKEEGVVKHSTFYYELKN